MTDFADGQGVDWVLAADIPATAHTAALSVSGYYLGEPEQPE